MSYTPNSVERDTFIFCFITVIWKRIFTGLALYCKQTGVPETKKNLLKSIKYNLLAPTGILNILRPYIDLALEQGFLMPNDIKNNNYVKNAIDLFRDAYELCKLEPNYRKEQERKYILDYCCGIYNYPEQTEQEIQDILRDAEAVNQEYHQLVDTWDLQIFFSDPEKYPIRHAILSVVFT